MADHRIHRVLHRLAALLGANPRFGSDEDLKRFGDTATRLGYPWALHENDIDIYPDAPLWDPSAVALT